MPRIVLSPAAARDLDEIADRIAIDRPIAARRFVERLLTRVEALSDFPEMGEARPEIRPGVRRLREGPYLVLYDAAGADVLIVRIVHGARDLGAL